ncbi:MAG: hypothetical protein NVS3B24_01680 [Candidatus Dormibacteria bacterium]
MPGQQQSGPGAATFRLAGFSLVSGCALLAVGALVRLAGGTDAASPPVVTGWFLQAVGAMLAVLGIPALYFRQVAGTALTGVIGLILVSLFFFLFGVFGGLVHATAVPTLLREGVARPRPVELTFFVGALSAGIGSLFLGFAIVRARVLSRGVAILVVAGGLALFAGHPVGMHVEDIGLFLFLAGLGWAGSDLVSR